MGIRNDQFSIWITIDNDQPDMEDLAKAKCELENMGINYEGRIGIGFTRYQWGWFLQNLSRFEARFASGIPAQVLGFPVRMIEEKK